ncbi:MAG: DMT family transporter [Candidatus Bathyarchaeia archaeon]
MKTKLDTRITLGKSATVSLGAQIFNYGLVITLSVIWGLAFVAIRRAEFELSPVNLTILRWMIASGGFLVLAPVFGRPKKPIQKRHIPRILLVSFASVVGYHLSLNYAETIVSSGLAGLLISFGPIFIVLLSALFLKEKIGRRLMLALALAVAGAVVLSINADLSFLQVTGPFAVILAAFMYGIFSVASKPLVKEYGALPTAIWVAAIGTVFALPMISWQFFAQVLALSDVGWLSVLYLAVLSTVVANMILYTLISNRAVSRLSVQLYLVPLVSLVGGILLLGESFSEFTVVGACFVFAGIALATHKH